MDPREKQKSKRGKGDKEERRGRKRRAKKRRELGSTRRMFNLLPSLQGRGARERMGYDQKKRRTYASYALHLAMQGLANLRTTVFRES